MKKECFNLDEEEQAISDAIDRGELKVEKPSPELLRKLEEAGRNTFKQDKRIYIRITSNDLTGIQSIAARKGIPYQTLISGLIHQYVEGDLVEKQR
jgi:predicted DNA binding CopG/RHH family protein